MEITVEQPDGKKLKDMHVNKWPTLAKETCSIHWHFDCTELSYFLEGHVVVETEEGKKVEVKKGDLAKFPKGLTCTWHIVEPMRKHFRLEND